jgi:hypothetical protein
MGVVLHFQSVLIRTHNVAWHRLTGWFGVAIPVLGISTAVTMARFNIVHFHSTDAASGLIGPFFDIIAFTIPFALASRPRRGSHPRRANPCHGVGKSPTIRTGLVGK